MIKLKPFLKKIPLDYSKTKYTIMITSTLVNGIKYDCNDIIPLPFIDSIADHATQYYWPNLKVCSVYQHYNNETGSDATLNEPHLVAEWRMIKCNYMSYTMPFFNPANWTYYTNLKAAAKDFPNVGDYYEEEEGYVPLAVFWLVNDDSGFHMYWDGANFCAPCGHRGEIYLDTFTDVAIALYKEFRTDIGWEQLNDERRAAL